MATDSPGNAVVRPISRRRAQRVVGQYHYARNLPPTEHTFGLMRDGELIGVCCYGFGANHYTMRLVRRQGWDFLELVRLALTVNEANLASQFIARTLQQLPRPAVIVAYADTGWGHVGKIYQAANWLYTGLSAAQTEWEIDGRRSHKRAVGARLGTTRIAPAQLRNPTAKKIPTYRKHRYFQCLGSRSQRRRMRQFLDAHFGVQAYPRGNSQRYDVANLGSHRYGLFT